MDKGRNKSILSEVTHNQNQGAPTGHLLSPNQASSIGTELHLIEMEPQNNPGCASPQNDGKAQLLKTPTLFVEHGKIELMPR